jgi:hypothetical protein
MWYHLYCLKSHPTNVAQRLRLILVHVLVHLVGIYDVVRFSVTVRSYVDLLCEIMRLVLINKT